MFDLAHQWAGDLSVSSCGDLALASDGEVVKQRVFRRLLTNPNGYLWHPEYGGGLSQFVGLPSTPADIEAVVREQLGQEQAVAQDPIPLITTRIADAANGYVVTDISFTGVTSQTTVPLSVSLDRRP